MQKDTIFVAIDDSKRTLMLGILRPGADEPETRSIPNESRHVRRLFAGRALRLRPRVRAHVPPPHIDPD